MELSGEHVKRIHAALLSGYDLPTLRMMVRYELNETLSEIVPTQGTLSEIVLDLIQWAEKQDRVRQLLIAAHDYQPSNAKLEETCRNFLLWQSRNEEEDRLFQEEVWQFYEEDQRRLKEARKRWRQEEAPQRLRQEEARRRGCSIIVAVSTSLFLMVLLFIKYSVPTLSLIHI